MTIPHDLPGDPPPEDDAVDLAARLIELINRYPHDAQGRRHLDEVRCVLDDHMKADDTIPAWRPVETWPNNGPGWARTRWIISQMLPASRVTLFSGEGAAGKTRIVMQLVVSLARGFPSPFLKKEPVQNYPHFDDALDQGGNPVPDWQGGVGDLGDCAGGLPRTPPRRGSYDTAAETVRAIRLQQHAAPWRVVGAGADTTYLHQGHTPGWGAEAPGLRRELQSQYPGLGPAGGSICEQRERPIPRPSISLPLG